MNIHSEDDQIKAMLACAFAGVQLGFRHLPLRSIINPPHELFDAHLARQVAVHIVVSRLDAPRRRVALLTGLGRWTIRTAVMTIDDRLQEPVFERAYRRMAQRALNLFNIEIQKAAA